MIPLVATHESEARRGCVATSDGRLAHHSQGPVDELRVDSDLSLRHQVEQLRAALDRAWTANADGLALERTEVSVEARGRRLAEGVIHRRVAATVRLVVRGPRTRSPVLWQAGGVVADLPAWTNDLAGSLPHELRAVRQGTALQAPWTGTLVLDPWVAALLMHECIGHTSEADNYLDHALPNGIGLGHRWTAANLTVVDDPTEPGRIGSYGHDDEGQPGSPTTLVLDGVWTGLLHSQATAHRLQASRSGNGRRAVGAARALPRMSVLGAAAGAHDEADLIGEVDDGWYCCGSWGAGSVGRRFVLRPTLARRIRHGRLQDEYLRRFELKGDKFATIAAIDAVGDRVRRFDPAFGCDKNGQDDLPVSFGAPAMRMHPATLLPLR